MKIALATRPCVRIYVTAHCRFHLSSDRRNSTPHTFATLNHPSQHQPLEKLVQDHKSCPFFRCNHGSSLIMSPLRTTSLLTCYQQEQGVRSRGPKSGTYKVFTSRFFPKLQGSPYILKQFICQTQGSERKGYLRNFP